MVLSARCVRSAEQVMSVTQLLDAALVGAEAVAASALEDEDAPPASAAALRCNMVARPPAEWPAAADNIVETDAQLQGGWVSVARIGVLLGQA